MCDGVQRVLICRPYEKIIASSPQNTQCCCRLANISCMIGMNETTLWQKIYGGLLKVILQASPCHWRKIHQVTGCFVVGMYGKSIFSVDILKLNPLKD